MPKHREVPDGSPPPGSAAAADLGCTCPVLDNAHGLGFPLEGKTVFWIDETCPLHAKREEPACG